MKEQDRCWEKKNIWNLSDFLKNKFLCVCPYGEKHLNALVSDCKKSMLLLMVLTVGILFLWNGILGSVSVVYLLESVLLACYIIGVEVPNYMLQERENKIYSELLIYFSRVKHRYTACKNMSNSVIDAADGLIYEVQRLADEIYRVLMEGNRKKRVRDYLTSHKTNRYMKLFLIQAYEASEKGDMFLTENIEHLRLELMEEIYRRKRREHEFAGYVFVTVTPFFLMPVLKNWGLEFAQELEFFYAGNGLLIETITFIATILIYGMISRAKEIVLYTRREKNRIWDVEFVYNIPAVHSVTQYLEKKGGKISNDIRQLILRSGERTSYGRIGFQMLILAISSWVLFGAFLIETHNRERSVVLEKVDAIDTIAPVASEEKQKILEEHILSVTRQCIQREEVTEDEIRMLLREKIRLGNENTEQEAVQEIKKKVEQYYSTKWSVSEVFICFLTGIGACLLPLLRLYYQAKTIYAGAAHEVRQIQSIILMERKLQDITVMGIMEDIEVFSQCFRESFRRCINSYGTGPQAALLRLKMEGSCIHESFEELADAFLSVDEVGVELAFAEVESNRRLLDKLTQLETEISMERKKDSTDLLARIPMALAVGLYFIIPFFVHSLAGVFEVFELLESLRL